ncbi:hypothetical protein SRHO_G00020280 [Serrasalmus rhombeus]
MKGQQKKAKTTDVERAEESQARQQPAAGEKESNAPHIPAALESGSLETISSVMLEKLGTPLHEDLQIETEAEPKAIKPLMYTDLDEKDADNNQPLGCEVMNVTDTEPEAPTLTMQTYSDEVDTPNDHPLVQEEMFEVMDTDDHLDTEIEYLEDETTEATLTEAEVEAVKELMLLFIEKIEAESLGCHVMSFADTEAEASTHNMQTHLDETDPSNDQLLDVEKNSNGKTVWNTIKGQMVDLLYDVQRTVDQSLGNESHKDANVKVENDDKQIDGHSAGRHKDYFQSSPWYEKTGMTVDPVPIKSWADMVDKTEGNINQTAEIEALKKDTPENETKRDKKKEEHQERNTRQGSKNKLQKGPRRKKSHVDEENSTRPSKDRGITSVET